MNRVGLISCAARKRNVASAAEDLYISDLFAKSKAFIKQNCDRWYILSAKYGLLDPIQIIEPYDQSLNTMGQADRRGWSGRVMSQFRHLLQPGDKITMLAGLRYRELLMPALKADGFSVSLPMEGMAIGKQLQWLNQHIRP